MASTFRLFLLMSVGGGGGGGGLIPVVLSQSSLSIAYESISVPTLDVLLPEHEGTTTTTTPVFVLMPFV